MVVSCGSSEVLHCSHLTCERWYQATVHYDQPALSSSLCDHDDSMDCADHESSRQSSIEISSPWNTKQHYFMSTPAWSSQYHESGLLDESIKLYLMLPERCGSSGGTNGQERSPRNSSISSPQSPQSSFRTVRQLLGMSRQTLHFLYTFVGLA